MSRTALGWGVALFAGIATFLFAIDALKPIRHRDASAEIRVALPLFVQVAMAGGDRFLAADMASVRALVTETVKMQPDEYKILGRVQADASWLNPAHEDNYYIAAAILPWNGEVDAAQTVLRRASKARFFDYQPAFFYAFNLAHFKGDLLAASEWLREAALKLPDDDERLVMQNFAARWLDRSQDLDLAIRVVEAMAKQAKRKDFRAYLMQRAQRLRDLSTLRRAASEFRARTGAPPQRLAQLVEARLLDRLPVDPFGFGFGFGLDAAGEPILLNSEKR